MGQPEAKKKPGKNNGKGNKGHLKINVLSFQTTRMDKRMINVISATSMDTIRKIARNVRHGSKIKVSLVLSYVLNQIWLKFLIILDGLILVVRCFKYDVGIPYNPNHKTK